MNVVNRDHAQRKIKEKKRVFFLSLSSSSSSYSLSFFSPLSSANHESRVLFSPITLDFIRSSWSALLYLSSSFSSSRFPWRLGFLIFIVWISFLSGGNQIESCLFYCSERVIQKFMLICHLLLIWFGVIALILLKMPLFFDFFFLLNCY